MAAIRDANGRFVKGSQISLGKHWKVKDSSKMGGKRPGNGFKEGNTLGCGKAYWKGKTFSDDAKRKMRASAKRGSQSRLWRGGVTPLRKQIRCSAKYKDWRTAVFVRDNFTCVLCGINKCWIEADHYPVSFASIIHGAKITSIEEANACNQLWDITNGRTLCNPCHLNTRNHGKRCQ